MGNKNSGMRTVFFSYLSGSNTEGYKREVRDYLENISEKVEKMGEWNLDVHFKRKSPEEKPYGNVFIWAFENPENNLELVCNFLLFKDRIYIPQSVSCGLNRDYLMIEKILKENYGDKSKLTNGFLGISYFFGMKKINLSRSLTNFIN